MFLGYFFFRQVHKLAKIDETWCQPKSFGPVNNLMVTILATLNNGWLLVNASVSIRIRREISYLSQWGINYNFYSPVGVIHISLFSHSREVKMGRTVGYTYRASRQYLCIVSNKKRWNVNVRFSKNHISVLPVYTYKFLVNDSKISELSPRHLKLIQRLISFLLATKHRYWRLSLYRGANWNYSAYILIDHEPDFVIIRPRIQFNV
jgi:hypothetical protein